MTGGLAKTIGLRRLDRSAPGLRKSVRNYVLRDQLFIFQGILRRSIAQRSAAFGGLSSEPPRPGLRT